MGAQAEILFLVHRAPWPPDRGDRIRSWHMCEALASLGNVHVAALCDTPGDAECARTRLESIVASLYLPIRSRSRAASALIALATGRPVSVAAFSHRGMARYVSRLIGERQISHIVAFSGQMAQYLPERRAFAGPVVMDFVDVDSAKFAAYARNAANPVLARLHAREARLLAEFEQVVASRSDANLFVSAAEATLFTAGGYSGPAPVIALENGIDTVRFDPAGDWTPLPVERRPSGPLCVFTGQMDYPPNVEAVTGFARDTLPLVRTVHSNAQFAIVGRSPSDQVRRLGNLPGVVVTGEVPDTRPWIAAADVVVAPLAVARGVQNKLLEAMAMARPVVASSAAAQGIDAMANADLLIADGAEATADAVSSLLADPARAAAIGRAARERMIARYGWAAMLAPLAGILGLTGQQA